MSRQIKSQSLTKFYQLLHARNETTSTIAEKITSSRSHVTQVLSGSRRGLHTWKRLEKVLTPEEMSHVRQCSTWNSSTRREA